jgi:pimeloyl-ACP methyl ester carboxylesterase
MRHRRLAPVLAAALVLAALSGPAPAGAARLKTCKGQADFECGTLDVPLDHWGSVPGTIPLHYAIQRRHRAGQPILIALSGGPGQSSIGAAGALEGTFAPALRRYRMVVLDQRGTGKSAVLDCPNVQMLRSLDAFLPEALAACAQRIGPRRAFFSTADTVADLEALRTALGAPKIAISGISYGTDVALQYARAFPDRVDRLILDSIVGPSGPNPFLLDTYRNLPRVLREQCAGGRCRGITDDPVGDVGALVARLGSGPLRGHAFDLRGRSVAVSYANADELSFLLTAGDLNPFLQAALPGAIASARAGDTTPLMRLRRIGQGRRMPLAGLSFGLNVTTGCLDTPLPYPLATPLADRPAIAQQALEQIPPSDYAPFDGQTVLRTSYVDDCMQWPQDQPVPPFTGPLPDVPALLLGGRLDTRTPFENAQRTAAELPHATLMAVPGTGHDTLDADITGCVARALTRFVGDHAVGDPCAGKNNEVRPFPRPPLSLRQFRSAPGVGGDRGREVFAVLDTVKDARVSALESLFANVAPAGGGLRAGRYSAGAQLADIRLHNYAYLPGLRVTGTVKTGTREPAGVVRVRGARGLSGSLRLDGRGGATGRLGGHAVHYRPRARVSAAADHRVDAPLAPAGPLVPRRVLAGLR